MSFRFTRLCLGRAAVLAAAVLGGSAWAFDIPPPPPPPYQGLIFPLFPNSTVVPFSGQSSSSSTPRELAVASPSQLEVNANTLAQAVPPPQREALRRAYLQAFEGYRQLERRLGITEGDAAGGVAAFIAGNYMAWRNVDVPDAHFQRMVAQVREGLLRSQGFTSLPLDKKRELYEQTAMVGTFMALARLSFQKTPQPAAEQRFRQTARSNLEQILQLPADQVHIDANGLRLGPA